MTLITLSLKPFLDPISDLGFAEALRDRDLAKLSAENPDARLETNAEGKLIIMSPTGSLTGKKNSNLNYQVQCWNRQYKLEFNCYFN